ncbi:MAG: hemolysin D, partial [Deltaproteobacteria bacterium]
MTTAPGHQSDARDPSRASSSGLDRPLALRRRPDVFAVPQMFSGQRLWALKDPVTLRYFHLRDEEYWVFQALDGHASLAGIQRNFEKNFAPRRLTLSHLQTFLGMLHQEGLILAEAPGQAGELLDRAGKLKRQKLLAALSNVLAIRFRGIDPQRFLDWILFRFGWLISAWSVALGAFVVVAAVALVLTKFDAVLARMPDVDSFLTPTTVIWLTVAMALVKILHELGHGLTCRFFGAECHELGLMFLVFTPCLYCNVSDSWMLESKWRRAAIGAAGVGVELVLAAACTLLWWFSEPGLLNSLCLNVMLICSAGTLLFNGNPLMRYDGYYILADLVEVPNLSQAATATIRELLGDWLLGIPARPEDDY